MDAVNQPETASTGEAGIRGFDLRLLGPVRLHVNGARVALKAHRSKRLLALLALNANTVVTADRIVDVLWDEPPSSVRQQVYNVVSNARRSLNGAAGLAGIESIGTGYQLTVAERCIDVMRFQQAVHRAERTEAKGDPIRAAELLTRALDEWQGRPLADVEGEVFENAATLLSNRYLVAVERLADLLLRLNAADAAVQRLAPLVAEHPFRESMRAVLMKSLYLSGRQAEAIALFEEGRRLLAEELGLDPAAVLQEAHQFVLHGRSVQDPGSAAPVPYAANHESGGHATARQDRPATETQGPSYLPRDIAEFTGRTREIGRILEADEEGSRSQAPTIVVIDGMGGVGKTTLAVHTAHKISPRYGEGCYFLDLAGHGGAGGPLTASQALSTLLRSTGLAPELIPESLADKSALWRSRTSGGRILVLLDNAKDERQVRPLLPSGPGALVLISARRRMTSLEGAAALTLDVLPAAEAAALFVRVAGADRTAPEPAAVAEAVELCGRLPLAVQVVAARFRDRPNWPVSYLVEQLRDQRYRSRLLRAGDRDVLDILAWSYDMLDEAHQGVFRLLSAHTGPDVDAHAVAALTGMPLLDAHDMVEQLCDANLIEQRAPGRYSMHDLVRDFANRVARDGREQERRPAVTRLIEYYLASVSGWCAQIGPMAVSLEPHDDADPGRVKPVDSRSSAIAMINDEYDNILAITSLAAEHGLSDLAWRMSYSLMPYFVAVSFAGSTEQHLHLGLDCARAGRNLRGEILCMTSLASLKRSQARTREAMSLLERAMALTDDIEDGQTIRKWQLAELGAVQSLDGDLDAARSSFAEGVVVAEACGDRRSLISFTNNLGSVSMSLGRLAEAKQAFTSALELCRVSEGPRFRAAPLLNLGQILLYELEFERAVTWFGDVREISGSGAIELGVQLASVGLANALRGMGEFRAALATARAALESAEQRDNPDVHSHARNAIGDIHLSMGDLGAARSTFEHALEQAERHGLVKHSVRAYEGLAHVGMASHDKAVAETYLRLVVGSGPGGAEYVDSVTRHLEALDSGQAPCWRCAVVAPEGR